MAGERRTAGIAHESNRLLLFLSLGQPAKCEMKDMPPPCSYCIAYNTATKVCFKPLHVPLDA
eukprot:6179192-Pleurochrysis_carterae.AAC.1